MSAASNGDCGMREQLAALAAGGPATPELAAHLARCTACRRALAELDPSALFGLLAALPAAAPSVPYPAALVRALPARRARGVRVALGAAAGLAACVALFTTLRAPQPVSVAAAPPSAAPAEFLFRVDSPRAQVVTLVPPGKNEPLVALIVGEEFDL